MQNLPSWQQSWRIPSDGGWFEVTAPTWAAAINYLRWLGFECNMNMLQIKRGGEWVWFHSLPVCAREAA